MAYFNTGSWKRKYEYPVMLALETTNKCNAKCWFCPITENFERPDFTPVDAEQPLIQLGKKTADEAAFDLMKRKHGYMSDDLFEKIIADCQDFPLRRLEPYLHGEPFMDPNLLDRIEYINRKIPKTQVHIFTNGSLITAKKLQRMTELKISSLLISLNTPDAEKYEPIMKLSFKKTMDNIRRIAAANKNKKVADRFILRMTAPEETTAGEIKRFKKIARSLGARPVIVSLHNYKGDINTERPTPQFPCYFVRDLDVLWDGQTALCCMDHDGEYSWGDVSKHHVLDVFNSHEGKRFRNMMREDRRNELDPCGTCNMFWWSFGKTGVRGHLKYGARLAQYMVKHRPLYL